MNRIKYFVIFFAALLLVGFVYAFLTSPRKSQLSTSALPIPKIPEVFEGEFKVSIDIEERDFDIPKTLPLLTVSPKRISAEESKALANNLGLNFEPVVIPDVFEGTKHRYSGDDYVLLVTLKAGKIDYERNLILGEIANKQLSDKEIIKIAEDFLTENEVVATNELTIISVSYFEERGGEGLYITERKNAYFYQVNFGTKISDISILTLNPQNSPVYVRILPDGTILKAHIEKLGQFSESDKEFKLKNYEELVNSKDEAILISLDEGNLYLKDIPSSAITQISITEIEIAYLVEEVSTSTLQPIFFLKGSANILGLPGSTSATFYLPAIKSP